MIMVMVNNKVSDPEKMFGINFIKRITNFLIKFTSNGNNSYLFVDETEIIKSKFSVYLGIYYIQEVCLNFPQKLK